MTNTESIQNLQDLRIAREALRKRIAEQETVLLARVRTLPKDAAGAALKSVMPAFLGPAALSLVTKAGLGVVAAAAGGAVLKKSGLGTGMVKNAGVAIGLKLVSLLLKKMTK
jgi:hypothetical protein